MSRNRIGVSYDESVNLQSSQTPDIQWRISRECFRRRKYLFIICLSIAAILIISGICIPTIIIMTKKENTPAPTLTTTTTSTTKTSTTTTTVLFHNNMKWKQNGSTVAGGNLRGNQSNQLAAPEGIYLDNDDNQNLYIADFGNHRIVKWKNGAENGEVLAGGNGMDQLYRPSDFIINKKTDSLIICDSGNKRVVRQSLGDPTDREIIIRDISCFGLAMDNNSDLYVTNSDEDEVRRWSLRDMNEVLVAGGNGQGERLNQLHDPTYIFVDEDHSVYVSELFNHRVTKWLKDAKEGIIVAGGRGLGNDLTQLTYPFGVFVDRFGNVYVADPHNHRVMRWLKDATEGSVVVQSYGSESNRVDSPKGLSFDRKGNLYLSDNWLDQVQKFDIDVN